MPKDFAGKTKKLTTYDKDWVFVKTKQKGPNDSAGAWVTKRQNKQYTQGQKEAHAYNQGIREAALEPKVAPPGPPALPATAPILGAPITPAPITPVPPAPPSDPGQPNPPSWWINQAIQNPTGDQQFANMANAILPTLAPEDQRTLASYLAQNHKDVYGGYANTQFSEAPTEMNAEWRKAFLDPKRAQLAVTLLDKMKTASGSQDMGAGYDYLKNAVNLMNQFTTGGVMTREKYQQFSSAVSALGKNATGDLAPYGNLAQLFNLPSFSAGQLVSNTPNNRLFS